jgi:hypothetical protein
MKLFAANRETFGPKWAGKVSWNGENMLGIFMKLCFTVYVHSMYSKGNEQVLNKSKGTSLGERKTKSFDLFFFCFNFKCLQSREFILFFTCNEFLFLCMFKIADLFLSVNVAFSLIKTHFVFGEFWFY